MAFSSTQKASSSSAPSPKCNFDVFLSFSGEDTRYNFTDHLFENLNRMGINTFRDTMLKRGEEITQELLGTIEGSRLSIIVFSEKYADSKWCLDELTKIIECKKEMNQIVLPVFYHVDPSDVRKQKGTFGTAFTNHEINVEEEKVQRWRAAMTEASNISGWHVKDGYESKPIKAIIDNILERLNPKLLPIEEHIVGMNMHLKELKSLLSIHLDGIRIVGIYGIGGIGKTTIAKIVYNNILGQFDGSSFLENVKSRSNSHKDRLKLLRELIRGILVDKKIKLNNISDGINMIKYRLGSKKVLIVIDDVDDLEQVKSLITDCKWFASGSRIIITTRSKGLLDGYGVHELYEAKVLCDKESIELFCWHAFKVQNIPKADYTKLSKCMVHYAQGLPLALKVLGSSLHSMKIDEWQSKLDKLKKNPDKEINDVLRISLDALDDSQKEVFLDVACFFKGKDKDIVLKTLACDNLSATYDIRVLHDRCLITIQDNMIQMHDLIQQMGWAIVREECPKDPSKWTRLWDPNDIYDAFSKQKGMKNVESISLDLSRSKEIWFTTKVFEKMKDVFAKMMKLRLLELYYSDRDEYKMLLPKDFEFPPSLRYLHWEGLKCAPLNFHGEYLVAINLKSTNTKELWKENKGLKKLKFIDLSDSQQLTTIPKFSSMPNLERLNLGGCTSFHKFHSYIGVEMKFLRELRLCGTRIKELPKGFRYLKSLEILDLSKCSKFEKFPDIFANLGHLRKLRLDESGIKELPNSIGYLEFLETLNLSSCPKFERFPEIQGNMKCLKELNLRNTAIKELPNGIGSLRVLEVLLLENTGIKELPNDIGCLETLKLLNVSNCSNFEKFPEIQRNMGSLLFLSLCNTAIKELPNSIGRLTGLQDFFLNDCKNLRSLPSSIFGLRSLNRLFLNGCSNVEALVEITEDMRHLHSLHLGEMTIAELPSSIERLKGLKWLELSNCENLETLPNSIGNLTCLKTLIVCDCSKLHKLPDNLRNLQCCLTKLNISGCNMVDEAFPSDLWCLSSLEYLNLGKNHIRCIPDGIIQLSKLRNLRINHCLELEEIPELPSSLRWIDAHGCQCLETLLSPTHLLWSSLLNCFKSHIQDFRCQRQKVQVFIPGSRGIPEWTSQKSMGCEVRTELPKNWYEDNDFLGFALFSHNVPLDDDNNEYEGYQNYYNPQCVLRLISLGDHSVIVGRSIWLTARCRSYGNGGLRELDPALWVSYFPQIAIGTKYRSSRWKEFKADFRVAFKDPFRCTENKAFKVKSCGIHPIYAGDRHQQI